MSQRQIPGGAFINEIGTAQRQIPGGAFVNETVLMGRFVRHYPNFIVSRAKLAGAVTAIDENPATPDAEWLTFDPTV